MSVASYLGRSRAAFAAKRRAGLDALAARAAARARARRFGLPLDSDDFGAGAPLRRAHDFAFLDAARDADPSAREALRAQVFDWLDAHGRGDESWAPDIAGRRLARLGLHHPLLARGASEGEIALLERALGAHLSFLTRRAASAPTPRAAMEAASGLVIGALAEDGGSFLAPARAALEAACARDPERMRNPDDLATIFLRLAEAVMAFEARGAAPPEAALAALAEIGPGLRALRHGDGTTARFHGGTGAAALAEALDAAYAALGAMAGGASAEAPMGFERMAAGRAVVLLDAAAPTPGPLGCASLHGMEFSFGRQMLFSSVGAGALLGPDWAEAARHLAAFSALEVGGADLGALSPRDWSAQALGREMSAPIRKAGVERAEDARGRWLLAEHDGWLSRFGLGAARRLNLAPDGRVLKGEDSLSCPDAAARARFDAAASAGGLPFLLRFHLHPEIEARFLSLDRVLLSPPEGPGWEFACYGGEVGIEDGVWLDPDLRKALQTRVLCVKGRAEAYWGRMSWSLEMESVPRR